MGKKNCSCGWCRDCLSRAAAKLKEPFDLGYEIGSKAMEAFIAMTKGTSLVPKSVHVHLVGPHGSRTTVIDLRGQGQAHQAGRSEVIRAVARPGRN